MEDNKKSYFGEIGAAMKTLAVGMKTTLQEYFTPKSTEQYPENRKTTLHVAARHRGRLVMNRDENGNVLCTACTLCEKSCPNGTIKILSKMVRQDARRSNLSTISMTLATVCSASCVLMHATSVPLSL